MHFIKIIEGKWNLHRDPEYVVRWFLCHPIRYLSPHILCLECRDHADYAQWALKYNPDKQKDYQYRREEYSERLKIFRPDILEELRQLKQGLRQATKNLYDEIIREMVNFFPDFEGEEKLREQDRQLDEFEERQSGLKRSLMEERRGDSWR